MELFRLGILKAKFKFECFFVGHRNGLALRAVRLSSAQFGSSRRGAPQTDEMENDEHGFVGSVARA